MCANKELQQVLHRCGTSLYAKECVYFLKCPVDSNSPVFSTEEPNEFQHNAETDRQRLAHETRCQWPNYRRRCVNKHVGLDCKCEVNLFERAPQGMTEQAFRWQQMTSGQILMKN